MLGIFSVIINYNGLYDILYPFHNIFIDADLTILSDKSRQTELRTDALH